MAIIRFTIEKEEGETTRARFKQRVSSNTANRLFGKLLMDLKESDILPDTKAALSKKDEEK